MKKMILIMVMGLVLVGCTNKEDAYRALNSQGFADIHITGYDFWLVLKMIFIIQVL